MNILNIETLYKKKIDVALLQKEETQLYAKKLPKKDILWERPSCFVPD
jgi:hypothetical protein